MIIKDEYLYAAKITNVVDGDTIDAIVDLGFKTSMDMRLRLYGVNTPEIHSTDEAERERAKAAKQFVSDALLNKDVLIKTHKVDKYGRYLAEVFLDEARTQTVNKALIAEGHAVEYWGGAR